MGELPRAAAVLVDVFVPGSAVGQGSVISKVTKTGAVLTHHPESVKEYRLRLVQAITQVGTQREQRTWSGAAAVQVTHWVSRPRSHYRQGRFAHLLRPSAPVWPVTRGADLDKVCRLVNDALTDAGVWRDDAQCVSLVATREFAPEGRGLSGLRVLVLQVL